MGDKLQKARRHLFTVGRTLKKFAQTHSNDSIHNKKFLKLWNQNNIAIGLYWKGLFWVKLASDPKRKGTRKMVLEPEKAVEPKHK